MPPVDECTLKPDLCGDGVCRDTDDGYYCECFTGFTNNGGTDKCYGKHCEKFTGFTNNGGTDK
jgi:hypothetical protein